MKGNANCDFSYIITFDEKGERVRRCDKILKDCTTDTGVTSPAIVKKAIVLELVRKNKNHDHKFVTIEKANGDEFLMVIDLLSMVKQKDREPERRCQVYFGFLCRPGVRCGRYERVALKHETNITPEKANCDEIRKQIDIAMDAGGRYNMKYRAYTNIDKDSEEVWIAMELCCMETLNVLAKTASSSVIKKFFRDVILGLSHLHSKNIAHREMIMENILLSLDRKHLKIGDYTIM